MIRKLLFLFLHISSIGYVLSQEEEIIDTTKFYSFSETLEDCSIDFLIPKEIDNIDNAIVNRYDLDSSNTRIYYFIFDITNDNQFEVDFFYLNDSDGKIGCLSNKALRYRLIDLSNKILVKKSLCTSYPVRYTVPIKLGGD